MSQLKIIDRMRFTNKNLKRSMLVKHIDLIINRLNRDLRSFITIYIFHFIRRESWIN